MLEKFQELLENDDFLSELSLIECVEDVQSFLLENGVELSIEDINSIRTSVVSHLQSGELSDDELELASGGAISLGTIALIITGVKYAGEIVDRSTRNRW